MLVNIDVDMDGVVNVNVDVDVHHFSYSLQISLLYVVVLPHLNLPTILILNVSQHLGFVGKLWHPSHMLHMLVL